MQSNNWVEALTNRRQNTVHGPQPIELNFQPYFLESLVT